MYFEFSCDLTDFILNQIKLHKIRGKDLQIKFDNTQRNVEHKLTSYQGAVNPHIEKEMNNDRVKGRGDLGFRYDDLGNESDNYRSDDSNNELHI